MIQISCLVSWSPDEHTGLVGFLACFANLNSQIDLTFRNIDTPVELYPLNAAAKRRNLARYALLPHLSTHSFGLHPSTVSILTPGIVNVADLRWSRAIHNVNRDQLIIGNARKIVAISNKDF